MLLGRSHRAITYLDDTLMHNRPCKLNGKPLTPQQTNTSTASISSASILSISQKNRLARHVIPMITRLQVTTDTPNGVFLGSNPVDKRHDNLRLLTSPTKALLSYGRLH